MDVRRLAVLDALHVVCKQIMAADTMLLENANSLCGSYMTHFSCRRPALSTSHVIGGGTAFLICEPSILTAHGLGLIHFTPVSAR